MWKSLLLLIVSIPMAVLALIIGWVAKDWRIGIISAAGTFGFFMLLAIGLLFFIREMSWVDVFLPIPIALFWGGVVKTVLSVGTEAFSIPAALGSGMLLTYSLWQNKCENSAFNKVFMIVPALVFAYEMIPIAIPGPIDDYFALGGACTSVIFQLVANQGRKLLT